MDADETREAMRAWLRSCIAEAGLSEWAFAERVGLATTTITRFLNKPVKHLLSARTLSKISGAIGKPVPSDLLSASAVLPERAPINPDLMLIALTEARRVLQGSERDSDFPFLKAETVASIYDRLADAVDEGVSPGDATKMIRAEYRRQRPSFRGIPTRRR
jgi:transcriptional regulator with XRE-family HTH domain